MQGMVVDIVSEKFGTVYGENGLAVEVDETFLTVHSVLYDAPVCRRRRSGQSE